METVKDINPMALDQQGEEFERVVKSKLAGKFDEWPNEAGVCHFSLPVMLMGYLTMFIV